MNPYTYSRQPHQTNDDMNPLFQKMVGIRRGVDEDVVEYDPSSEPYINISQQNQIGEWDFTDQQKHDFRLNGLVQNIYEKENDKNDKIHSQFIYHEHVKDSPQNFSVSQISGNMEETPLTDLYFSKINLQALQDGIRFLVYKKSYGKHTISEQSTTELILIMRSIYLQHGQNLMFNIVEQVKKLNQHVLDYAVPKILSELDMYERYLRDKSTLPTPLTHSQNVSSKGEKVLEFKGFF